MTETVLALENVQTYYGHIHALRGVSLAVRRGQVVALLGANGAGKSTTLRTISGLVPARSGRILFEGADITRQRAHLTPRMGLIQVPEGRRIFPRMTVFENLQMGAAVNDFAHFAEDLERVCATFPRLKERLHQRGGTLSGGEQQMLAIARCLMGEPQLVMFDEPSLGLAPTVVETTFEIIGDIRRQGTTILMVEQNAHLALQLADRGYVIETGRIVLHGLARDLLQNDEVRRAYLGG